MPKSTWARRLLGLVVAIALFVAVGSLLPKKSAGPISLADLYAAQAQAQTTPEDDHVELTDDPTELFENPTLLASVIDHRVTGALTECMHAQGLPYLAPDFEDVVDTELDPSSEGYRIAAGGDKPIEDYASLEALEALSDKEEAEYEDALYGGTLSGGSRSSPNRKSSLPPPTLPVRRRPSSPSPSS